MKEQTLHQRVCACKVRSTDVIRVEAESVDIVQHSTAQHTCFEANQRWKPDSLSPPVHGKSMAFPRNHFRSHAVRRPTVRERFLAFSVSGSTQAFSTFRLQLLRATQIDNFDVASRTQDDVARLDIAMHEAISVHVRDCRRYFRGVKSDGWYLPNGVNDKAGCN